MPDRFDTPEADERMDDACRRPVRFLDLGEDGVLRTPPVPDEPLHPYPGDPDFYKNAREAW